MLVNLDQHRPAILSYFAICSDIGLQKSPRTKFLFENAEYSLINRKILSVDCVSVVEFEILKIYRIFFKIS